MQPQRILVVRLGAMGDVIHALPAVATVKRSLPSVRITWVIDPKWAVLLENNPYVHEVLTFNRHQWAGIRPLWSALRTTPFDVALDFQGVMKSAIIAAISGARRRIGFSRAQAREPLASIFYNRPVTTTAIHIVDRNLELAQAVGVNPLYREFPLPAGRPEGDLPDRPFILTCPLAGWSSKQWPLEYYSALADLLREQGWPLVVNGSPAARATLSQIRGVHPHLSGIEGLIDATRRAAGVIGVDSGPLHLAAALGRPGVAIFGPTDPARNGPYGGTITVLRDHEAQTTYRRGREIASSMRAISPGAVLAALRIRMDFHAQRTRA